MKYVRQLEIIIVILFLCFATGVLRTSQVREVSTFLLEIMPMMFIAPAVGLVESWGELGPILPAFITVMLVSTIVVLVLSGRVTQWLIRRSRKEEKS